MKSVKRTIEVDFEDVTNIRNSTLRFINLDNNAIARAMANQVEGLVYSSWDMLLVATATELLTEQEKETEDE